MTLKDIAQEVGVSISTVSRVINRKSTNAASKHVQDRIWEIVQRSGYIPNANAQNLRSKDRKKQAESMTPHIIACLLARSRSLTDPFFMQLARSVEEAAYQKKYIIKFLYTRQDLNQMNVNQLFQNSQVEGVVVLGRCEQKLMDALKQHFKNLVCVSLNPGDPQVDQVCCDGCKIGYSIVEHLVRLGHSNIGYVGETYNELRYEGYLRALKEHNITFDPAAVVNVMLSSEGGYRGAKQLMKQAPHTTAIFCANDETAVAAVHALHEEGYRIPQDISVISTDNLTLAQYVSPMLTTAHIPVKEMGNLSFKCLVDRIEGGHHVPLYISVPFSLVERESCAPLKR